MPLTRVTAEFPGHSPCLRPGSKLFGNTQPEASFRHKEAEIIPVAQLTLEIEIPHAQSLKDRRQVVRSLKDKLRQGFNLSVAELDEGLVWNRATIGIATISNSTSYLTAQNQQIDRAAARITSSLGADITDSWVEILSD